jgi:hypothetical protein
MVAAFNVEGYLLGSIDTECIEISISERDSFLGNTALHIAHCASVAYVVVATLSSVCKKQSTTTIAVIAFVVIAAVVIITVIVVFCFKKSNFKIRNIFLRDLNK